MPALELSHLSRAFGGVVALDDLSLAVRPGEIYGFVGANGAGKTTAMRIALGVLAPDSGEVLLGGKAATRADRTRFGYMPEERGLYPTMKVGSQLTYLAELHGLSSADAKAKMEHWTDVLGVAARRSDPVQKLSLGNQQRVQLAAALVHEPDVLVLDEPFSGLDPIAVDVMSQVMRQQAERGVPVIFSSHQLDLVERLCDRVGIIQGGCMVASGTIQELRKTPYVRFLVRVDGPGDGDWARHVSGVEVVDQGPSSVVVELRTGDVDAEQRVLRAAIEAGTLREFTPLQPSLAELFRDVVAGEGPLP